MTSLNDDQRADLERLRKEIAEEEPRLAAAIGEYNATTRAAYEKLIGLAAGYLLSRDEFENLLSEVASAMMEFAGEAGDDWQQGEEGQGYLERMNAWIEAASIPTGFERPRELTAPEPPLSAVIAGLPREIDEVVVVSEAGSSHPASPVDSAQEDAEAETAARRYFEFAAGTSNKFWEVLQEGGKVTTRWGKIGSGGQSKAKSFDTDAEAAADTAKAIAKKVKEGYVEKKLSETVDGPADSRKTPRPGASGGWSGSADPEPMLGTVLPNASDRKRRLFAVACCRREEDWLVGDYALKYRDDHYHKAVEAAECFADGDATPQELGSAFWDADDSAFCNEYLEELTGEERRKACLGDDAGWPGRLDLTDEEREDMEAHPDPVAWFEANEKDENLPSGVDPFRDVAEEDAVLVGETIGRQVLLLVRHYGGQARATQERAAQAALLRDIFGDPYPPPTFDPAWRTPEVYSLAESIYEGKKFDRMSQLADTLEKAGCSNTDILDHCRGTGPHVRGCWVLDLALERE